MTIKARGRHYFQPGGYPVTAVRVTSSTGAGPSHPFDLTRVEHDHDFNELVMVAAGSAIQHIENWEVPVGAGDVYILQSRHRHYFHDLDRLELVNVMYDPSKLSLPVSEFRDIPGYNALFLLEPRYRRRHQFASRLRLGPVELARALAIADGIVAESQGRAPGRGAASLAKLIELIIFLSRQYGRNRTDSGRALLRIGDVLGRIEREYDHPWTIHELASLAGMSRSTFLRTFEDATGHAPIEYLIRKRIAGSMKALRETDDSITDIAFASGFSDSNYFTRQFRKITGMTPTTYRAGSGRFSAGDVTTGVF